MSNIGGYKEASNRPRTTQAVNPEEAPLDYLLRLFEEGKLIYDDGDVYSTFDGRGKGSWREIPKKVGAPDSKGYIRYSFRFNGRLHAISVHRLIYAYFFGKDKLADNLVVNHKDGNPANNRIENLELCTTRDNIKHAIKTRLRRVENTNTAKLDWEKVREIRQLYSEGLSQNELAKIYGVYQSTISAVILNKTWRDTRDDQDKH